MKGIFLAGIALFALSACGQAAKKNAVSGAEVGDKLDQAADQSGPAAKEVLQSEAAEARQHPSLAPVDDPSSFAQQAMEKAGKAEESTLPRASEAASRAPAPH